MHAQTLVVRCQRLSPIHCQNCLKSRDMTTLFMVLGNQISKVSDRNLISHVGYTNQANIFNVSKPRGCCDQIISVGHILTHEMKNVQTFWLGLIVFTDEKRPIAIQYFLDDDCEAVHVALLRTLNKLLT